MGIDYNSQGVTFDTKDSYGARLDTYGHDGPGNKIALDLLGRKHVERADNADGVYWLQKDTRSSLVVFPVPGASSADTFRKFLREHLPYSLITDEYGCAMPSEQISDDHLPALQTHLWRSGDDAITAFDTATREQEVQNCGPFIQHRSRMMPLDIHASMPADQVLLVAHYVRFIIALLECEFLTALHHIGTDQNSEPHLHTSHELQTRLRVSQLSIRRRHCNFLAHNSHHRATHTLGHGHPCR
jgi:hypothetical protein